MYVCNVYSQLQDEVVSETRATARTLLSQPTDNHIIYLKSEL